MAVTRGLAVRVTNFDQLAVALVPARLDHAARARGIDGRAVRLGDVGALVEALALEDGMEAVAEGRGDARARLRLEREAVGVEADPHARDEEAVALVELVRREQG